MKTISAVVIAVIIVALCAQDQVDIHDHLNPGARTTAVKPVAYSPKAKAELEPRKLEAPTFPACKTKRTRTVRIVPLPDELVGKTLRIEYAINEDLAKRLGVTCVPCSVRVLKANEVEISEGTP